MTGYIKLHRKMTEWGWYSDPNTFRVFMHLLLIASYEENEFRGQKIMPGEAVVGRKQLAKDLCMSEQSVRTALSHLKSTNEITTRTTNKFTVVTIVNWGKYQCDVDGTNQQTNQQANQPSTNNQPTTNHTQEIKKYRNNNNVDDGFDELWELYPRKSGKKDAHRHYRRALKDGVQKDTIKSGILSYREYIEKTGTDPQYVKMGSSFFCQRSWDDDWTVPEARAKPKSMVPHQQEPPKYPEFPKTREPEKKEQMPDSTKQIMERLGGMFK